MFWLPIWMPDFSHRYSLSYLSLRTLADPFVRFFFVPCFPVFYNLWLCFFPIFIFSTFSSISISLLVFSGISCAL